MRLHFGRNKKSSSQEVWHGRKAADIPCRKLGHLNPEIFASYSGPDLGLAVIHDLEKDKSKTKNNGMCVCVYIYIKLDLLLVYF